MSGTFNVNGDLTANNILANNDVTVSGDVTVGDTVTASNYILNISPSSSETVSMVYGITTDNITPVQIASIPTVAGCTYLVTCNLCYGLFTGTSSGAASFAFKILNTGSTTIISNIVNLSLINDSGLTINASNVITPMTITGNNVIINIVGQEGQDLIWSGYFKIIQLALGIPMA